MAAPATTRRSGRRQRGVASLAAAFLPVAFLACQTGVHFHPRDWRGAGPHRWAATLEDLDIETSGIAGRARARVLYPELTIHNASLAPAVVTGGRLATPVGVFESEPVAEPLRTVAPGETRRVTLEFRLDRPIREVLVDPVSLTVLMRTASGPREVAIALRD